MPTTALLDSPLAIAGLGLFLEAALFLYLGTNGLLTRQRTEYLLLGFFLFYGIVPLVLFISHIAIPLGQAFVILWLLNLVVAVLFVAINERLYPEEALQRELDRQ